MNELVAPVAVGPVVLDGRYIRLEPLSLHHVEELARAASEDRSTYRWATVPDGVSEMRDYVSAALALAANSEAVPFATVLRESGRIVGATRFANFERHAWPETNPNRRVAAPDAVEIGWTWLAASAQRTPVNTEAKWLMLRHAFEAWGVRCVRLKTDRRNERSRAAIERIGARFDGVIRSHSPGADGTLRDSAYFSILAAEWASVSASLLARLR